MMMSLGQELVTTLMTKEIISVCPNDSLIHVKNLLIKNNIRHLVVLDDDTLVGIISKNDIDKFFSKSNSDLSATQQKLAESLTVQQLMTKSLHTLQYNDSIKEAAEILALCSFHALPVLQEDKLVGILTSTDLLLYLLKYCK